MSFADHLNPSGLGDAVEVFPLAAGFTHHDMPLVCAFNPACIITSRGTLLAFAEGRLGISEDHGLKTVLVNRSDDMGRTWEGMRALIAPGCSFGPRPYLYEKDGRERIGVLVTHTPYGPDQEEADIPRWLEGLEVDPADVRPDVACLVVRLTSDDDGQTWRQEVLTGDRDPFVGFEEQGYWTSCCDLTGTIETIPCGPHAGRLFVAMLSFGTAWGDRLARLPGDHYEMESLGSSLIVSDDGETWRMGGVIADWRGNEAAAASVASDGRILMLRRPNPFTEDELQHNPASIIGYRLLHTSFDGGDTWSAPVFPEGLPYLKHGGRRYDYHMLPSLYAWNNTLITVTPSGVDREANKTLRSHGVIGFSDDLGVTWRYRLIDSGWFSYATVGRVGDDGFIVMFSRGHDGDWACYMRAFTMDWLREA